VKVLTLGCAAIFGLALAPVLVVATPAGGAGLSATTLPEVSGVVRAAEVRPLFPDVPAGGYPDHFPFGQCTWWAAFNVHVTWWGDAGRWVANARATGRATSPVPVVHSIVVYEPSPSYSLWGHVGLVVAIGPGSFQVSEMNYADGGRGTGTVDQRESPWPDPLVEGFILPG
jgi:CHAP domain